jgi:peptidoglycan/xylan/chitin deacetylase (PgdA/CDA1 family)
MTNSNAVPALVISLDFELFWGVSDSKTISGYGKNIEGVWEALPAMLALFKRYGVHVTWATVGMLMCKDFKHWNELRPSQMATYERESLSTYSLASLAQEFPKLFFGRPLVEQILSTDGQELASHSYSHFYCGENGANIRSFVADMDCNRAIFNELGFQPTSFVFPRNQMREEYLSAILAAGFTAYRGNQAHWLYQQGSSKPRSSLGRFMRFADDYLPLTGSHAFKLRPEMRKSGLLNVPASRFFRPSRGVAAIDRFHLRRVKGGMLDAARTGGIFHLWWHPHNFGSKTGMNLENLECVLRHYRSLNQLFGMRSLSMNELTQNFFCDL